MRSASLLVGRSAHDERDRPAMLVGIGETAALARRRRRRAGWSGSSRPRVCRGLLEMNRGYRVVPVPFTSNGAAASDCSELPSSRRNATGVVWSLPPKNVESPVTEYSPAPGLIPSPLALVVSVTVQGFGAGVPKHVPLTVAVSVAWY